MAEYDVEKTLGRIEKEMRENDLEMQGLSVDGLRAAMSHPKAAATVKDIMTREESSIQAGDDAPDFELPRLHVGDDGAPVTLSSHFGKRPVALIFGSYT